LGPTRWAVEHWLQDFDQAQVQAHEQRKDVLLLFDSSDWSNHAQALAREVLARPELWQRITSRFIPVHIDFPEYPRARKRVREPQRNEALQARFFQNPSYPTVVLTDAGGRPYAVEWGYAPGQAEQYINRLEARQEKREDRDELVSDVETAEGKEKLPAAQAALNFLGSQIEWPTPRGDGTFVLDLAEFYDSLLTQWRALADQHDPETAGVIGSDSSMPSGAGVTGRRWPVRRLAPTPSCCWRRSLMAGGNTAGSTTRISPPSCCRIAPSGLPGSAIEAGRPRKPGWRWN
jgi:hypothetical protein